MVRSGMLGKPLTTRHRYSVWRVLKALGANAVGRGGPRHAILWRLPDGRAAVGSPWI
jgi:hypothetical protein